ncbi:MAG: hypothetical protein ACUVWZ_14755 [Anaerolineae bacterium]
MKRVWDISLLLLSLLLIPWNGLFAAPLPPRLAVNHETRQCGEFIGGDECMDCFPPAGWEVLGVAFDVSCPEGYTHVGQIDYHCQPFKVSFCCSEGHSGAPGDCEDLVVSRSTKQCAFVEEIATCRLPKGWSRRPDDMEPRKWVCPAGYEWIETLPCEEETGPEGPTPTPGREGTLPISLPCPGAAVIGLIVAGWLRWRR